MTHPRSFEASRNPVPPRRDQVPLPDPHTSPREPPTSIADVADEQSGSPTRQVAHEGFPTLSPTEAALTMARVSSGAAVGTFTGARQQPVLIVAVLVAAALIAATLSLAVLDPVIASEQGFTAITTLVVASLVTLGLYLMLRQRERFTGAAFIAGGVLWLQSVLDIYPPWGPFWSWVAGASYAALGWGILRYRHTRLEHRWDRLFPPIAVFLTSGLSFLMAPLIPPQVVGLPPDSYWPRPLPGLDAPFLGIGISCIGFIALAAYFTVILFRAYREAPPISRGFLRPMVLFGAILAVGSALIQTVASIVPGLLSYHHALVLQGALILGLVGALGLSMTLQQLIGARFVSSLPLVRTPETVSTYLRRVINDPSAELLYWSPEDQLLLDDTGRHRNLDTEGRPERFTQWIHGTDGAPIALLTGAAELRKDAGALDSLVRVVSIIAENTRLSVLLRMRVAQLTATRTAEELAFTKAREQFHRDLHDGLQQTIATLRMDIDGLRDVAPSTAARFVIDELETKLTLALDQVHSLKRGAAPPELRFGLKPAIDRVVAQLHLSATITVCDSDLGVLSLPVYYLVRESLTNVHKHARAHNVEITITTDGGTVKVLVRDDGIGGAVIDARGGIGGMRRRVHDLGGTLHLDSIPHQGTTMRASIPCVSL